LVDRDLSKEQQQQRRRDREKSRLVAEEQRLSRVETLTVSIQAWKDFVGAMDRFAGWQISLLGGHGDYPDASPDPLLAELKRRAEEVEPRFKRTTKGLQVDWGEAALGVP
jgi:hypothetical protein